MPAGAQPYRGHSYVAVHDFEDSGVLVTRTVMSHHRTASAAQKVCDRVCALFLALFGEQYLPWSWSVIDLRDYHIVSTVQVPWALTAKTGAKRITRTATTILGQPIGAFTSGNPQE
jgi:hypothetical protein